MTHKTSKAFNVIGACRPDIHYMVNLAPKLKEIKRMIDNEYYFTINKARQYGKTTTLRALSKYLRNDYTVASLDFQQMSTSDLESESAFVHGMARELTRRVQFLDDIPDDTRHLLLQLSSRNPYRARLADIFDCFRGWCDHSPRPVVLIIDEVDTAADNQVFLDFLAQLRAAYLDRDITPAFQSVILARVYDIRNIRRKLWPEEQHKANSR